MPFGQTQPPAHPYAGPRTRQREQHTQRQPQGGPVWGKSVCKRVEGEKEKKRQVNKWEAAVLRLCSSCGRLNRCELLPLLAQGMLSCSGDRAGCSVCFGVVACMPAAGLCACQQQGCMCASSRAAPALAHTAPPRMSQESSRAALASPL